MKTFRILLGLTGLLTVLAITAAPAAAEFQALQPNTTQGPYQLKANTPAKFTSVAGGKAIECTELSKGEWHIQTKFSKVVVTSGVTKVSQDLTKDGAHEGITGGFTKCTTLGGAVAVAVNPECSVQIEQAGTGFTGSVVTRCILSINPPGGVLCEVTISAGNPNSALKAVTAINITGGQENTAAVTGITSTGTGGCTTDGIETGKTGEFNSTGIAHSQKVA